MGLAERTGPRFIDAALLRLKKPQLVISGEYIGARGSLTFTGKAVDTRSGDILFTFDSVSGKEFREAVDGVRQRAMAGIGTKVDPGMTAWAGSKGLPPIQFTAYQEFAAGMTSFVDAIARTYTAGGAAAESNSARVPESRPLLVT